MTATTPTTASALRPSLRSRLLSGELVLRVWVPSLLLLVGLVVWTRAFGIPKSRAEVLGIVSLIILVMCKLHVREWARAMVVDWAGIFALLVAYDIMRGYADELSVRAVIRPQLRADEILFGGEAPTVTLQQHLWNGHPRMPDYITWVVYTSHFFVPMGVAVVLWYLARPQFRVWTASVVALSFMAFATYWLVPAAPPWMAGQLGVIDPVTRVVHEVWSGGWAPPNVAAAWDPNAKHDVSNPVAALPSLHAAFPMLLCLFFWTRANRLWKGILAWYVLAMGFALVYGGEHYVFDVLLGWLYAALVHVVVVNRARIARWIRRGNRTSTT